MSEGVGLIVAAVIAGYVAFFGLIISKEQSVSEFRQRWIDALRDDIATVISCVTGIQGTSIIERDNPQLWNNVKADFIRFYEVMARIKLRLNPIEKRGKEKEATAAALKALDELDATFRSPEPQFFELKTITETLATNSQVILKENWKRVRSGETVFRITKWLTLAATVLVILGWVLHRFNVL
ncbi:MAG TPA: hypothetical protein VGJ33_07610 [Candidatus Angelobacter sp.]|jgi:hypothetical protein